MVRSAKSCAMKKSIKRFETIGALLAKFFSEMQKGSDLDHFPLYNISFPLDTFSIFIQSIIVKMSYKQIIQKLLDLDRPKKKVLFFAVS